MKVLSVNVALPRLVAWKGQTFNTGIFKKPVAGPVTMRKLDFDGDRQADLSVHGGPYKAVYAYPSEHYEFWRKELPEMELPWGQFGENLTTEGLNEEDTHIGDVLRIGKATVQVTQPRLPGDGYTKVIRGTIFADWILGSGRGDARGSGIRRGRNGYRHE